MKFKDSEERKLFVTGCLHLNHNPDWDKPLWDMRGYKSCQEMTDSIIFKINETCRSSDVLLVLGDFCLNTTEKEFNELISRINPELYFIYGNHNSPWEKLYAKDCREIYNDDIVAFPRYWGNIKVLGYYVELYWNKKSVICNHYAYQVWNSSHHGSWSLCSHSHGTLKTILPEYKQGKQLDCGWDVHSKPLSFSDIDKIMKKKEITYLDHHNNKTNLI